MPPGGFATQLPVDTVDLDVTSTVYAVRIWQPQFVFHQQMRIGYHDGSGDTRQAITIWNVHVARTDNNLAVALVVAVVGLWKTSMATGDEQVCNTTLVALAPMSDATCVMYWGDDGQTTFLAGSATGIPYNLTATAQVEYPSSAVDTLQADNTVVWGVYVAKTLPGDVTGEGYVDLWDALRLAYAFGSYPGHRFWNPYADFNDDSQVDIFDAILLVGHWYQHVP
jgi:hypothetical protein